MKILTMFLVGLLLALALSAPIAAASEEALPCDAAGTAEGQTLYSCYVDGTFCVWDPSPTLGAGVLDCDW